MAVASPTLIDKTDEQRAITEMVRQFADEQILPHAEHYDAWTSTRLRSSSRCRSWASSGSRSPRSTAAWASTSRPTRWSSRSSRGLDLGLGIINTHFIGSYLLMKFGTDEQKAKYLPRMATGELRAAFSLSEPELGSDVQAIKTSARKTAEGDYEINGQKMWVTNGLMSGLVFVLVRTDPDAQPRHRGMTCFIAEKEPGVSENTGRYAGFTCPRRSRRWGTRASSRPSWSSTATAARPRTSSAARTPASARASRR
jgi:alkylation response protein AidB-like acyl-CoA dehydrogenase